jgi:hypothetical protein
VFVVLSARWASFGRLRQHRSQTATRSSRVARPIASGESTLRSLRKRAPMAGLRASWQRPDCRLGLRAARSSAQEKDRDRFGRIVAICRASGEDLGAIMVREGLAWAFTGRMPPTLICAATSPCLVKADAAPAARPALPACPLADPDTRPAAAGCLNLLVLIESLVPR